METFTSFGLTGSRTKMVSLTFDSGQLVNDSNMAEVMES